jgi:hypothetical protein
MSIERATHPGSWQRLRYPVAIALVALSLASVNFPYGFSGDMDGHFLHAHARAFPDQGYQPSRSWGFPAYEIVLYPLVAYLGTTAAKAWSLLCYVMGSLVFFLALREVTLDPVTSFLGALCLTVLPIAVISGNTTMETSQGLFLALLGLYFYIKFAASRNSLYLYLAAAGLGLATSSRPDYVLFSACVALTILRFNRPATRQVILGTCICLAFALLPFLIYPQVHLGADVVLPDPLLQRISRAAVGGVALVGVPYWVLLSILLVREHRHWPRWIKESARDSLLFLSVTSFGVYAIRFVLMPDELEYVLVLVPLLIMGTARLGIGHGRLVLLALALAIPNVAQLHFFSRTVSGELSVAMGISPGAMWQDRSERLRLDYVQGELRELMGRVSREHGQVEYAIQPSGDPGAMVIIPEDRLRFYDPSRHGGRYHRVGCSQTILVYPMPSSRGWRQLTKFESWRRITLDDFREVKLPYCEKEAVQLPPRACEFGFLAHLDYLLSEE